MLKFLIQTIETEIKHDFSFNLLEACNYLKWIGNDIDIKHCEIDEHIPFGYVPVGSVDFVCKYLDYHYDKVPKPINCPTELLIPEFTGRHIFNGTEKDINQKMFVKSNDKIKHFTELTDIAPIGNYQISEQIDIDSEYRVFVYKNEMLDYKIILEILHYFQILILLIK